MGDHGPEMIYRSQPWPVAETILNAVAARDCDWLLMGAHGSNPVIEAVLGIAVDEVLRRMPLPMLICR